MLSTLMAFGNHIFYVTWFGCYIKTNFGS